MLQTHVAEKLHPKAIKSLGATWWRTQENVIKIICLKYIEPQQFEKGTMKEENNVKRERIKMKTTNKTYEWRKKKQHKLQDENQQNFHVKMKQCMVVEQHCIMTGYKTLAKF